MSSRLYKFLSAENALTDLAKKRLKITRIDELNDPFDLRPVDTTDTEIGRALAGAVEGFRKDKGLLCFSRTWNHILLWSHYGSSHRGLCLGFDIPDSRPEDRCDMTVKYQKKLLEVRSRTDVNAGFMNRLLRTKHKVWSYEQEVRMFVQVDDPPDERGMTWFDFGKKLELKEVIIGARCSPEDAKRATELVRTYNHIVSLSWADLAKDRFLVVRSTSPPSRLA